MINNNPPTKLADIYATPKSELAEDDLSFLRAMIDRPPPSQEPIDYEFLKNELIKRRPLPAKKPKGIGSIENQVKAPTRGPKYIKSNIVPRQINYTFEESDPQVIYTESVPTPEPEPEQVAFQHTLNSSQFTSTRKFDPALDLKPTRKKKFVAWKYIGDADGVFGTLTGKLDAPEEEPIVNSFELSQDFANLPYKLNQLKLEHIRNDPKPKVKARDLFALSIADGTREQARLKTIDRLKKEKARSRMEQSKPTEPESQLYIETEESKLIPIVPSRLNKQGYH